MQDHASLLASIARQAMIDRGLQPDFSAAAEKQLASISQPASENGVRDLRDLLWCSIDNDDSRDLDQLTVAGEIDVLYSDRHAACYPLVGSAECFAAGSGPSCRPDPRTAADAATTGGRSVEAAPLLMEERGGRPDLAP